MAALPFSFRNDAKSEVSPIHSLSRMAKTYRDVRQIRIKKVPHRVKQFTPYGRSEQGASIGHRGTPYGDSRSRAKSMRLSHLVNIGEKTEHFLQEVGVSTQQELQAIGSVEAWRRLKRLRPEQATLTCLYRLQGALLGVPWNKLPEEIMEQLLDEVQADV
jgi:DNA transformation protein and related proteins